MGQINPLTNIKRFLLAKGSRPLALAQFIVVTFIALITFIQCAHVEAPSGGKVDKVPPQVKGVFPARDQTGLPLETPIKIVFTEWMNENLGPADVQISPPVLGGLEWEMISDELVIQPRTPLDSATTYNLLLSRDLKDLRGNPLDLPFSLTFSTGPQLDSLTLSGQVFASNFRNPPTATRLGLYTLDSLRRQQFAFLKKIAEEDSLGADTVPRIYREFPLYQTSADSSGLFTFKGIAPGKYRLVAFVDANRNSLVNQEYEEIALYSEDLNLETNLKLKTPLVLGKLEKVPFLITEILPIGQRYVEVKFNNPLNIDFNSITIRSDSTQFELDSNQWIIRPEAKSIILRIDSLQNGSTYKVQASNFHSIFGEELDSLQWEFPFTWQEMPFVETNKIAYRSINEGGTVYQDQNHIDFHYQNPILAQPGDSLFLLNQSDTLIIDPIYVNEFTLRIQWEKPLSLSTRYSVIQKIPPSDSLPLGAKQRLISFNTPDPLKIGTIKFVNPLANNIRLRINHLKVPFKDSLDLAPGQEKFMGPLPEGAAQLSYYYDLNQNKRRDLGAIDPYEPAEPILLYPDTLFIPRSDTLLIDIPLEQN